MFGSRVTGMKEKGRELRLILTGQWPKERGGLMDIALDFRVSRVTAAIAFSKLKKHRLVIVKRGAGSFVA